MARPVLPETIRTTIMVMSDTHDFDLDDPVDQRAFSRPLPSVDVLLHCGDLTNTGSLAEYKRALKMLGSIDAKLKLVIPGSRDVSLDNQWWQESVPEYPSLNPNESRQARELMTGSLAQGAGVTYLEEGVHTFGLENGAKFTVYASPYQPVDHNWAFYYERNHDRFNIRSQVPRGTISIARAPIPDLPIVDIVMTHVPPRGVLDQCKAGNVGCANLLGAVQRVRPRLHCFGHVHEARGAQVVSWKPRHRRVADTAEETAAENARALREPIFERKRQLPDLYPNHVECEVDVGHETLMVNASIMNRRKKRANHPWIFDLALPSKAAWTARSEVPAKSSRLLCCAGKVPATLP